MLHGDCLPSCPSQESEESEESLSFKQKCHELGIRLQSVKETPSETGCSLGYGTFSQIQSLLQFDIPVLLNPSEEERSLLARCGYSVHRLLALFQYSPDAL